MSICEHYPIYKKSSISSSRASQRENNLIIQDELLWGLTYRNYKKKAKETPIPPKKSPIDIPFKICREEMRQEKKLKKTKKKPKKKPQIKKPSLLERSIMSQNKYMEYLSIPNPKFEKPPPKKRKKRKCEIEPCPPRLVQLAVPNKRRVFANWKEYHNFLPTEMVMRFEQILHTDKNLEPREARFYYKILDKKKRKELREKKKLKKKKKLEKEKGDKKWLKDQIDSTASAIVDYMKEEPLFSLNYKQLMLSDGILERLEGSECLKKPSRNTKSAFKNTIIEVSDKMAVWMDTLTRFVDVQAVDSEEDIPPLTISSLEGEEAGSSEFYSSSEEEGEGEEEGEESKIKVWEGNEEFGEEGLVSKLSDYVKEKMLGDIFRPQPGEGVSDLEDFLGELDVDLLDKLIEILGNCSEDFLMSDVEEEKIPGVRYNDILDKLKELKYKMLEAPQKPFLEKIMIDWAMKNDPDKVDQKMLKQIHDAAALLGDWLYPTHRGTMLQMDKEPYAEGVGPKGEVSTEEVTEPPFIKKDIGLESYSLAQLKKVISGKVKLGKELSDEDIDQSPPPVNVVDESEVEVDVDLKNLTEQAEEERLKDLEEEIMQAVEVGESGEGLATIKESAGDLGATAMEEEKVDEVVDGADTATELDFNMDITKDEELSFGEMMGEGYETTEQALVAEELEAAAFEVGAEGVEEPLAEAGMEKAFAEEGVVLPGEKEISVIYGPGIELTAEDAGKIIKGHKPSIVLEHTPSTVCCLSLKTWAVWLLEITHNAHNWTKWMHGVIMQVREFVATIRGDVILPNGQKKVLQKQEWRQFAKEVEQNIVAWRQYSAHVKELSGNIIDNFHEKKVNCCPKCLQDHLIKNVVNAHETLEALTEAMNCASYWQRSLDQLVEKATALTNLEKIEEEAAAESSESEGIADIEEVKECTCKRAADSEESIYEIEELELNADRERDGEQPNPRVCDPNQPGQRSCGPNQPSQKRGCGPNQRRF